MLNKFKAAFTTDSDIVSQPKSPLIVGFSLVYVTTIFLVSIKKLDLHQVAGFTIVMMIQLVLYLFLNNIFKHKYWIYFGVQGMLAFNYAIIAPMGYVAILLGLIPVLIFQGITIYSNTVKVIFLTVFFYSIFCINIIVFNGLKVLIDYIPILLPITSGVYAYAAIFLKQVKLRIETQKILRQLEFAYEKVEDLTIINERQRIARDLHDTLSQGLAGLIMQLDAVNANLNNNNIKRAQEIVQNSMKHARKTLSDSRLVIDDLRINTNTDLDFAKAVENETAEFKGVSHTSIETDIRIESELPINIYKHILYIVRESLNNIAKHSKAKNALVEIIENHSQINITIIDDGIGFDTKLLDNLFGHYGILGISERVRNMNGKIEIKSDRKSGTKLKIIIPIRKGINNVNE
ncbi:signal transduction histidine kinase [Desulfosporosinus orientis DSM 765]|uniref:histidine kinase n=1 Tax=Desulfosporosinus orientis (strain ATCC 19365 / DSM 765 / NCIMB 8382 / VKM B-1628 / Singapore I) TaxID=768706 RepID=G7W6B7_DESOD|nr:sensor histidine kinase [Desulfosporosinus orientis]AET68124.1 signal transduction histidine kinase [Desulfosporosinus orientis DSM 765]